MCRELWKYKMQSENIWLYRSMVQFIIARALVIFYEKKSNATSTCNN